MNGVSSSALLRAGFKEYDFSCSSYLGKCMYAQILVVALLAIIQNDQGYPYLFAFYNKFILYTFLVQYSCSSYIIAMYLQQTFNTISYIIHLC